MDGLEVLLPLAEQLVSDADKLGLRGQLLLLLFLEQILKLVFKRHFYLIFVFGFCLFDFEQNLLLDGGCLSVPLVVDQNRQLVFQVEDLLGFSVEIYLLAEPLLEVGVLLLVIFLYFLEGAVDRPVLLLDFVLPILVELHQLLLVLLLELLQLEFLSLLNGQD